MSILVLFRVSPESVDTDLNRLEEEIRTEIDKVGSLVKIERKPVAFGLFTIDATALLDEDPKLLDKLEASLSSIEEVRSVQVKNISKSL